MATRIPAEVFPPGEFIKDELEARDWTQLDLAEVLGRPAKLVSELLAAKRQITPQTATELAGAFGTDPQFWMNLESAYQLSKTNQQSDAVARRSKLYEIAPVKELMKRGWIESTDNVEVLEARLMSFLEIKALDEEPVFAYAAKATPGERPRTQVFWQLRCRQLASRQLVPAYSESRLRSALPDLRKLLVDPYEIGAVTQLLHGCGVRFVVVEALPGSKIDGACFWLDDNSSPVIALSNLRDRIDNFWFVLRHEIEHVLQRDGAFIDHELNPNDTDVSEQERMANEAAGEFCIPKQKMDNWMLRKGRFISEADLIGFARVNGVHPGIVAGQLCNRTGNHKLFSKHRVKVRQILIASAPVDGWGKAYLPPRNGAQR